MKKYINQLLSFFTPIFIMLIALLINKFYPFGNKIFLMLDGINQYPGFLSSFMDIIKKHESILYSFSGSLGFNYYPVAVYYVFNLTNIIALFINKINILDFYTITIILKMGLCSLTMSILLNYLKINKWENIIFSICYGLMAYNLLYYLNYMWFDSIIMLPLVILGIEKIFNENKYILYCISLALAIIFNYYIGYMICVFSLIYFIYKYIINKSSKKVILKFIIYSICAGLLSSVATIPSILELLNGKSTLFSNYVNNYFNFDFDFLNIFYKFTIGSYLNGDLEYGTPNVYVSIFVVINVFLFFFNKKIKKREKIITGCVISFFLLSMSFNLLDYFWQAMQMPIWYPVRYSFIFDFFLILIAVKNYRNINYLKKKDYIISLALFLVLIILGSITAGVWNDKINIIAKLIYLGISLIFMLYYYFMLSNNNFRKYIWLVLIIELGLNTIITFKNNANENTTTTFNTNLANNIETVNDINDNGFYRLTIEDRTIKNNGLLVGYNDLNYFSSVRNNNTFNILHNYFNVHGVDNCNITYYYNDPIVNSLFDIKYYVSSNKINYYDLIKQTDSDYIYQNNDAISIGFLTNDKILGLKYTDSLVSNINNLVSAVNNKSTNIIKEISPTDKNISCSESTCITNYTDNNKVYINYEIKNSKKGFYFIQNDYSYTKDLTNYEIKINDVIVGNDNYTAYLVDDNDNININLTLNGSEYRDYDYHVYYISYDDYLDFVKTIQSNQLEITDYYSDSHFIASINVTDDNQLLFTSIPNDDGWTVYVDNKKTDITKILDGLIGIKLSKGTHTIEFKYETPGLKLGIIISSITLIFIICLLIKTKKSKN